VDGHVPFRVTPDEAADAGQRTAEHPEALAAGCSIAAEAERKRFARARGVQSVSSRQAIPNRIFITVLPERPARGGIPTLGAARAQSFAAIGGILWR
jgi:hypothetical protein